MQRAGKLFVIGIGYRPLDKRAREILLSAGVILASGRLFGVFKQYDEYAAVKDRLNVINKVPETMEFIKKRLSDPGLQPTVLLASGDPQFFGIARRVVEEFGPANIEIFPDLSSMQVAFARIKQPWDDAFFISLHGGPDVAKRRKLPYEVSDIPFLLQRYSKIGILTDNENNPAVIARVLQSTAMDIKIAVCERLGYSDERIIHGRPDEISEMSFSDPNVVIIQRADGKEQRTENMEPDPRFGLTEDEIQHERGLITKDEVRAVTIHKLRLPESGVLWDIGAGSGSVSLEAARLCPGLRVFAVEKEQDRINTISANVDRHHVRNIKIISGSAPEALADLPAPDRVFIGGSGGNLVNIVKLADARMQRGVIVLNSATLETLHEAVSALTNAGFEIEISQISVSRSKLLAGKRQMSALNPVFIVQGEKG